MSDIKWCDAGGHAFSTNDKDRKSYVETGENQYGETKRRIDICGPCHETNQLGLIDIHVPKIDQKTIEHPKRYMSDGD